MLRVEKSTKKRYANCANPSSIKPGSHSTCGTGGSACGTTWDMSQADFFLMETLAPGTVDSLPAVPGELS